ncbi:MAG: fructosamine kinase family protein [Lachnospiraceae bacterium]|nr:fructosamine kinase family protein [Lachnospiraceae bacterium]
MATVANTYASQTATLSDALYALYGEGVSVKDRRAVHGGDCNDAHLLTLTNGARVFLKSNSFKNAGFFTAEAGGLAAIAGTKTLATPKVLAYGADKAEGIAFLLMEYIEEGRRKADFFEAFGRNLAAMHKTTPPVNMPEGKPYGFHEDNIIGFRPQINTPHADWISFYRDCRLSPQLRDAQAAGYLSKEDLRQADSVMAHLDRWLTEPEAPSLVHGDLWGGNYMTASDGSTMIIDPAAYIGHREVDLAMSEMFGGFPAAFYRAYREAYPLQPGYEDRRPLYDLYQMLNHLNQFGTAYLGSVRRILQGLAHTASGPRP